MLLATRHAYYQGVQRTHMPTCGYKAKDVIQLAASCKLASSASWSLFKHQMPCCSLVKANQNGKDKLTALLCFMLLFLKLKNVAPLSESL